MPNTLPNENSIVLCLDFDGTLTNRAGRDLVFGEFYKSLQVNPHDAYSRAIFKPDIQGLFETKFNGPFNASTTYTNEKNTDTDILISNGALNFLKEALSRNSVNINIITRNREDYIRHVLTYQGFSESDITKIKFYARVSKDIAANRIVTTATSIPTHAIVCDDDECDAANMQYGLKQAQMSDEQISLYHNDPGAFEWEKIREKLLSLVNPTNHSTPIPPVDDSIDEALFPLLTPINTPASIEQDVLQPETRLPSNNSIPDRPAQHISSNRYGFYGRVALFVLTPPFAILAGLFNPALGITIGTIAALMLGIILISESPNLSNTPHPITP